jgi:hypothetical protein
MALSDAVEKKKQENDSGNKKTSEPSLLQRIEGPKSVLGLNMKREKIMKAIMDHFRETGHYKIYQNQIEAILELVPAVFPEHWQGYEDYNGLTSKEQEGCLYITSHGSGDCPCWAIEKVIELALEYESDPEMG